MLNMWLPPKCYPGTLGQCPGRAEPHFRKPGRDSSCRRTHSPSMASTQRATGLCTTWWWSQCCGILRGPLRGPVWSWARPSRKSPGRLFAARLPPWRCSEGPTARQEEAGGPRGGCSQEMAQVKEWEIGTGAHWIRVFSARCLKNKHHFAPSTRSQSTLQISDYPPRETRQMGTRFTLDSGPLSTFMIWSFPGWMLKLFSYKSLFLREGLEGLSLPDRKRLGRWSRWLYPVYGPYVRKVDCWDWPPFPP